VIKIILIFLYSYAGPDVVTEDVPPDFLHFTVTEVESTILDLDDGKGLGLDGPIYNSGQRNDVANYREIAV
jgi:hypothetical protein